MARSLRGLNVVREARFAKPVDFIGETLIVFSAKKTVSRKFNTEQRECLCALENEPVAKFILSFTSPQIADVVTQCRELGFLDGTDENAVLVRLDRAEKSQAYLFLVADEGDDDAS